MPSQNKTKHAKKIAAKRKAVTPTTKARLLENRRIAYGLKKQRERQRLYQNEEPSTSRISSSATLAAETPEYFTDHCYRLTQQFGEGLQDEGSNFRNGDSENNFGYLTPEKNRSDFENLSEYSAKEQETPNRRKRRIGISFQPGTPESHFENASPNYGETPKKRNRRIGFHPQVQVQDSSESGPANLSHQTAVINNLEINSIPNRFLYPQPQLVAPVSSGTAFEIESEYAKTGEQKTRNRRKRRFEINSESETSESAETHFEYSSPHLRETPRKRTRQVPFHPGVEIEDSSEDVSANPSQRIGLTNEDFNGIQNPFLSLPSEAGSSVTSDNDSENSFHQAGGTERHGTRRKRQLEVEEPHQRKKAKQETPNSRKRRLEYNRLRARDRLQRETPNTRKRRLEKNRLYARKRLNLETPNTRKRRLQVNRLRYQEIIRNETDEERQNRRQRKRTREMDTFENLSPTTKRLRLSERALAYRNRMQNLSPHSRQQSLRSRQLSRDLHALDFEQQINNFMDIVCAICTKMCFKNQAKSIVVTAAIRNLVPNVTTERISSCNRCADHLSKGKIPSTASWNKMRVAPIPDQLKQLTELEIRLLCRVVAFIKVIRLGGPCGQYGLKGQAILFAQQVEEVAEQLPLSADKSGIVIVAESLENVNSFKQFSVDLERIKNALDWLVANNHLYANVRIDLDHVSQIVDQICSFERVQAPNCTPGIARTQLDFSKRFKQAGEKRYILRGNFHQGSIKFSDETRDRQSTAIAAVASIYCTEKHFCDWESNDLDRMLLIGNSYYKESMSALNPKPDVLTPSNLLHKFEIVNSYYSIQVFPENVVYGIINPRRPEEVDSDTEVSLLAALGKFFTTLELSSGVLTCNDKVVSVCHQNDFIWLFDSQSRGPKGFAAKDKGTSMLMRFESIDDLAQHLLTIFQVRRKKDVPFNITFLDSNKLSSSEPMGHHSPQDNGNSATLQPVQHFRNAGNGKLILQGHFHQGSERFSEDFIGRQCAAICACALGHSCRKKFEDWDSNDIDLILVEGDHYYQECVKALGLNPARLISADELLSNWKIAGVDYCCEPSEKNIKYGVINPSQPLSLGVAPSLSEGLRSFCFDDHFFSGILTCKGYSMAFSHQDYYFWLFDSHARDERGYMAQDGRAMVMRFESVESLSDHVLSMLLATNQEDVLFSIAYINARPRLNNSTSNNVNASQISLHLQSQNGSPSFVDIDASRISLGLQSEIQSQNDIPPPTDVGPSQVCFYSQPMHSYRSAGKGKFILHGHFHQGAERFSEHFIGRQCAAICACALGHSCRKKFEDWDSNDIDLILVEGDHYYQECVNALGLNPPRLISADELLPNWKIAGVDYRCEPSEENIEYGVINPSQPSLLLEGVAPSLRDGLANFLLCYSSGILTCKDYSMAVSNQDYYFWLFDSHARDDRGYMAQDGRAMVMRFESVESLSDHVLSMLLATNQQDVLFSIAYINARPRLNNSTSSNVNASQISLHFQSQDGLPAVVDIDASLISRNLQSEIQFQNDILPPTDVDAAEIFLSGSQPIRCYRSAGKGKFILHGHFHQGSEVFSEDFIGRQCAAICACALGHSCRKKFANWDSTDIDLVLVEGDHYYQQCVKALNLIPARFISPDELLPNWKIGNVDYHCEPSEENIKYGVINPSQPSLLLDGVAPSLRDGLANFFLRYFSGILTCSDFSMAVSNQDYYFWLFDSHARNEEGYMAQSGTAMVMRFESVESLSDHVLSMLHTTNQEDVLFSIAYINARPTISRNSRSSEQEFLSSSNVHNPQMVTETVPRTNAPTSNIIRAESFRHLVDIHQPDNNDEEPFGIETTALLPVDMAVPDVSDIIENEVNDDNTAIPIHQLKRKTAPPASLLKERRAEELSFFTLFPDGRNGLNEDREIPITTLDYYQNRIMSSDSRFQRLDYLFYALSAVELHKVSQNVSVCGRLRQGGVQPQDLIQNVHLSMRNIRGTHAYWHKAFTELMAMVKNIGPPSWFITLSCNDLHWPDTLKALLKADRQPDKDYKELSFAEKKRLVESYPVVLSRQFMFRWNAFFRILKRDPEILAAPITDSWWRIEYQLRGSPHVHFVVWCEGLPDFDSVEGIEVINRVATCAIPTDDDELKELVLQSQKHKHTHSCFKKDNQNVCRFQYPRPVSEETKLLGPDEAMRNGGRFCIFKRTESEQMINTYNPKMLKLWKANMDIQPCGNAIGVAYYISKYIAKSEPIEIKKSIAKTVENVSARGGNFKAKIFAVQAAILNHRQVSACEAAFRLCHLMFKQSSRKCVFVNSCIPEQRYRMLRLDSENSEPFRNIFDRYVSRPENLEELSLGEFAIRYEHVSKTSDLYNDEIGDQDAYGDDENDDEAARPRYIRLLFNGGLMKIRKRVAILRTRYFSSIADPEAYYYSLLVVHVAFRDEGELLAGYARCEEAFFAKRHLLRPLQGNIGAETAAGFEAEIQQAIRKLVAERLVNDLPTNNDEVENDPVAFDFDDDMIIPVRDHDIEDVNDVVEGDDHFMPDAVYEARMGSANILQRRLISIIDAKLRENPDANIDPFLVIITGGAGSGKTYILKLIEETIRRFFLGSLHEGQKAVMVAAPTGVAARLINGVTLHSLFSLPVEKGNQPVKMVPLQGERLQRERSKWRSVKWLIIDEISMVSYKVLRYIHIRLQELKNNNLLFGGINVLLFGDLMQLPPVNKTESSSCFQQPLRHAGELHLWRQFGFCELTTIMRQQGEDDFISILNNLRVGQLTSEQLDMLERRMVPLTGEFADGEAIRIFATNKLVDKYNDKMSERLSEKLARVGKRVYIIRADDVSKENKMYNRKPDASYIPNDPSKCGGFPSQINLGEGSRVMLRSNLNVSKGLVNGAMGVVRRIEWSLLRRDQLEEGELPDSILVQFDDPTIPTEIDGCVRIKRHAVTFDGLKGSGKIERTSIPVILCWAVTVHKLQGVTLDKAVVDLGPELFAKGQAYVALSRVRSIDGLAISRICAPRLLQNPHDEKCLQELARLRSLPNRIV